MLNFYKEIDREIAEIVSKYFLDHAVHWLSPQIVSLSVFSEVLSYCMEAETFLRFQMWSTLELC